MQKIAKHKKTLVALSALVLFVLSIVEGQRKAGPAIFSVSNQEIDPVDKTAWVWLLGRKGWMPFPDKTRMIQIDMKSIRGNMKVPLKVILWIPGGVKKVITFPASFYQQSTEIDINTDITDKRLLFTCSSTWSPASIIGNKDNRNLCIYARIKFLKQ